MPVLFYSLKLQLKSDNDFQRLIKKGLPGLIFSGFIFAEELFIYCGFINRIKISAHPHSHCRPPPHHHSHSYLRSHCHSRSHHHSNSYPHHHSNSYPHHRSNSYSHLQDCVGFISTCTGIFQ